MYPLYIAMKNNRFIKWRLKDIYDVYYNSACKSIPTNPNNELQLFSNLNEDGIILWVVATLGIKKGYFVDIGSNDCINSNCANLAFNFNWDGIFIDSDEKLLQIGKRNYKRFGKLKKNDLQFVCSFITPENINNLLEKTVKAEVDFLSIDIDGNDYEILEALHVIQPKIIVIENKVEYGNHDIAITKRSGKGFEQADLGASPYTMTKLAETKGYTLIAANKYGFNTFYLRNNLVSKLIPPLAIQTLLSDPKISKDFYPEQRIRQLKNQLAMQ